MRPMHGLAILAAVLGLASAARINPRDTVCNNSPDLCSRSYSDITYLGAHDSAFVRDASTDFSTAGNHYFNSTVALSYGVRLLTAQVHQSNGGWHLCHTSCDLLDAGLLSDWLTGIRAWMDENPNDVVTVLIVNSDNATPADLDAEFSKSGITKYAYTPPQLSGPPMTWPTLQELISANTRLITFVASLNTATSTATNSYLLDEFTWAFENPFDNTDIANFSCIPNRPSSVNGNTQAAISSGRLSIVNHFLDKVGLFGIETPDVDNITTTNSPGSAVGSLGSAASECKAAYGKAPNFFLVDFFDKGPAIETVDSLNGISNPVGRTPVPNTNSEDPQSASGAVGGGSTAFAAVTALVNLVAQGETPTVGAWIWAGGNWKLGGINLSGGSVIQ